MFGKCWTWVAWRHQRYRSWMGNEVYVQLDREIWANIGTGSHYIIQADLTLFLKNILAILGFEFRALCLLEKHCTTWATPSTLWANIWMILTARGWFMKPQRFIWNVWDEYVFKIYPQKSSPRAYSKYITTGRLMYHKVHKRSSRT
jgi:hypothetical protein